MSPSPTPESGNPARPHIIGLGTDHADGHTRISRGPHFEVLMGSEQTHEELQRICLEIERRLEARGLQMGQLSKEDFLELIRGI